LSGLGEAPATNPELRAELETASFESLLRELRERDPAAYEKIDKQNPRRVIRAVEVIRLTGKKFSEQRAEWKSEVRSQKSEKLFALSRQADDLHARINARVDAMFARGLVDETRELLKRGLAENKTAMQAIGYRQVVEHLRGESSLTETIEMVKSRTRQFTKRQLTWFRRQLDPEWIELKPDESPEEILPRLNARIKVLNPGVEPLDSKVQVSNPQVEIAEAKVQSVNVSVEA
jgi:tRNA dimethylallyltransferase